MAKKGAIKKGAKGKKPMPWDKKEDTKEDMMEKKTGKC